MPEEQAGRDRGKDQAGTDRGKQGETGEGSGRDRQGEALITFKAQMLRYK